MKIVLKPGLWMTLLVLLACAATQAQDKQGSPRDVYVDASGGLGGLITPGLFTTANVELRNQGPARQVTVSVLNLTTTRRLDVDLDRGAYKRVQLTFPAAIPGRTWRVEVHDTETEEFLDGVSPRLTRVYANETHTVAFVGKRPPGLVDPSLAQIDLDDVDAIDAMEGGQTLFPEAQRGKISVVRSQEEALPGSWRGYDVLNTLVWSSPKPERLSLDQVEALQMWILEGGHLVVAPGESWRALASSPLGSWLPASPEALKAVPRENLRSHWFQSPNGQQRGSVAVLEATARPGAEAGFLPDTETHALSWTWPIGRGHITMLAAEPGAWSVAPELEQWQEWLIRAAPHTAPSPRTALLDLDEPRLQVNILLLLLVLVLFLLIIGPVDYLVLRKMRRLEWTLVTYPAAIVVFAGLTWLAMANSMESSSREATTEIITWHLPQRSLMGGALPPRDRPQAGHVQRRWLAGFFPDTRQRLRLSPQPGMRDGVWRIAPALYANNKVAPKPQELVGFPASLNTVAAAYAMVPLETSAHEVRQESPVLIQLPTAGLKALPGDRGEDASKARVTNHMQEDLELCWLRHKGWISKKLFKVPAGQTVVIEEMGLMSELNVYEIFSSREEPHAKVLNVLSQSLQQTQQGTTELVCVSQSQDSFPVQGLEAGERVSRKIWHMID